MSVGVELCAVRQQNMRYIATPRLHALSRYAILDIRCVEKSKKKQEIHFLNTRRIFRAGMKAQ
jgi:hypothetical protein